MCILSGQRSQTITLLSTETMYAAVEKCILFVYNLLKQSRPKHHQQPWEFLAYSCNPALYAVHNLHEYLNRTSLLRGAEKKRFLSYVNPHEAATSATIAQWICSILNDAGIPQYTSVFTAHSTRSASTSKSKLMGLSLSDIGKAVGWSSPSVFRTFYNKPVVQNFGQHVLSKKF